VGLPEGSVAAVSGWFETADQRERVAKLGVFAVVVVFGGIGSLVTGDKGWVLAALGAVALAGVVIYALDRVCDWISEGR
jgi:hypothetical protein